MEPTLTPRKFKIEHNANDYVYYVELVIVDSGEPAEKSIGMSKWVIQLGISHSYLRKDYGFDFGTIQCTDKTAMFDTPEEALEFWKEYIASYVASKQKQQNDFMEDIRSRVESSRTAQAG